MARRPIPRWATATWAVLALTTLALFRPDVDFSQLTFVQWVGLVWLTVLNGYSLSALVLEALLVLAVVKGIDFVRGRKQPEEKREDYSSDVANFTP